MPDTRTSARVAVLLATSAAAIHILSLFLPLHYRSPGVFGTAFPTGYPLRLDVGFALNAFTIPLLILIGAVSIPRASYVAAGVFLASGAVATIRGLAGPLYADAASRPRAFVLMILEVGTGVLLLAAAVASSRASYPPRPD